jgi:cytochrome c oxidase assembly factor CtaG
MDLAAGFQTQEAGTCLPLGRACWFGRGAAEWSGAWLSGVRARAC